MRVEVLYQIEPQHIIDGDHYPNDYAGKVVAMKPVGAEWYGEQYGRNLCLVTLDISEDEFNSLNNKELKVVGYNVESLTLEDRFGDRIAGYLCGVFGGEDGALEAEKEDFEAFQEAINTKKADLLGTQTEVEG